MCGCESWTIKKAEHQKIDAFELWFWRRFLRVPWTARRSNQSILKDISPGCSLEGLMLKLKSNTLVTWYEELTHWKSSWCWERCRAGGEGDDRGWDDWMASPTRWMWVWVNSGSWSSTGKPGVQWFMGSQRVGHDWETELNWIELKITVDGDYSHEIKRCLLLGRKALTNLNSILKNRGIILLTKAPIVQAMVFPVVMYGCESWTTKKSEYQRVYAFELWCWRRLSRVPWTTKDM